MERFRKVRLWLVMALMVALSLPVQAVQAVATTVEVNNGSTISLKSGDTITGSSSGGIPIDVRNIVTAADGLAAFDFTLNWNPAVIQLDAVRTAMAAIDQGWAFTLGAINNTTGTVSFVGTTTQQPWSKADITLAYLGIRAVGNAGDTTTLALSITHLVDSDRQAITPRSAVNAPVIIRALQSVGVTPANPSIALGLTQQFTATGLYSDNSTKSLTTIATWTSSNPAVADINSAGLATSRALGTTIMSATYDGISTNTSLTVTAPALLSIVVTPANPSMPLGLTQQFDAAGTYTDSSTTNITGSVTWSSSNTSVATISTSGLAISLAQGTTNITATSGAVAGNTTLTVTVPVLLSIAVTPDNPSIALGRTQQFTATGTYTGNTTVNITGSVTWSSSNTSVATIGGTGLATSVGLGTTTINATSGHISSSTNLLVVSSVEVNSGNSIALPPGGSINATGESGIPVAVKNLPNLGTDKGVAAFDFTFGWNPAVIRVNSVVKGAAAVGAGWELTPGTPNNTTGVLRAVGTRTTYDTNDVILLYLGITAVAGEGDNTTLSVTVNDLLDNLQRPIAAAPVNAPVEIINPVAETSLAQAKNSNGVIAVRVNINRVKYPSNNTTAEIPGGIGSYSATVSSNASSSIQFLAVRGVSPFDGPSFNATTGVFSVDNVTSPVQASNTTVAKVVAILTGNTTTTLSLTVAFQAIGAAGQPGLNVPEERANTITLLRGDANGNGALSIADSLVIKQYLVGQLTLNEINPLNAASVQHDGAGGDKITVADALAFEQFLVGQLDAYFQ